MEKARPSNTHIYTHTNFRQAIFQAFLALGLTYFHQIPNCTIASIYKVLEYF